MVCIYCRGDLSVSNSRPQKRSNQTWRRRLCGACGALFTSIEALDLSQALSVDSDNHKHNNKYTKSSHSELKPFDRDKLFISLYKSLQHRPAAISDARGLSDTVVAHICVQVAGRQKAGGQRSQVAVSTIYTIVLRTLQRFDKAAATHYAAFHPQRSTKA